MVAATQPRNAGRRPAARERTASCIVPLEATRARVNRPLVVTLRSTPGGGQGPELAARRVKYAANRALKNISSEASQTTVPTVSTGVRSCAGATAAVSTAACSSARPAGLRARAPYLAIL